MLYVSGGRLCKSYQTKSSDRTRSPRIVQQTTGVGVGLTAHTDRGKVSTRIKCIGHSPVHTRKSPNGRRWDYPPPWGRSSYSTVHVINPFTEVSPFSPTCGLRRPPEVVTQVSSVPVVPCRVAYFPDRKDHGTFDVRTTQRTVDDDGTRTKDPSERPRVSRPPTSRGCPSH